LSTSLVATAQPRWAMPEQQLEPVVEQIVNEANQHAQLKQLAHELLDVVGPRLVGTPQMKHAQDWAVAKYAEWGIEARYEEFGEWRGWDRGISHIDMVYPRVKTLAGTQLAWSPTTGGKEVEGEVITLPDVADSLAFQAWLPNVKGKYVMISMLQPTGRPDYNWEEYGKPESIEKMKRERDSLTEKWRDKIAATGVSARSLPRILEEAGAAGILECYRSREFGSNKIFGSRTTKIPSLDISLEDYGVLYRLAEN